MTFFWLVFWFAYNTPPLHEWNTWAVALVVCIVIDVVGGTTTDRLI